MTLITAILAAAMMASIPTSLSVAPAVAAPRNPGAPIVLLIDLSSSMDGQASGGLTKLDSAKQGMNDAISTSLGLRDVGVWTFPNDGNCGAGQYVVTPADNADAPKLHATITNLQANGNTPTAQALEALGERLIADGDYGASIILVSDGESNCSPPKTPCEVAKELAAKGFAITVNTIGFQISDKGRTELQCIAAATEGKYVDAEDGEELIEEIADATSGALNVSVTTSPQTVVAGGDVTVTATIHNPAAFLIEKVNVTLTFTAGSDSLPAVVPPRKSLGAISPDGTLVASWTLSLAGLDSGSKQLNYRVFAYGKGAYGEPVDGTIMVQGTDVGPNDWGPITIDGNNQIVIMGDSYSSGQGTFEYMDWRDGVIPEYYIVDNGCHTSHKSYAFIPKIGEDWHSGEYPMYEAKNLACSGAVIQNLITRQTDDNTHTDADAQLDKLAQLETAPRIVFLTLGGNDIGFANIISSCVNPFEASPNPFRTNKCPSADDRESPIYKAFQDMVRLQSGAVNGSVASGRLAAAYRAIWHAANTAAYRQARLDEGANEYAPVVVLPYPVIAQSGNQSCGMGGPTYALSASDVVRLNDLEATLNGVIRVEVEAAAEARFDGSLSYAIFFANPVHYATLGHSICRSEDQAWINKISLDPESAHPTIDGYKAEGTALRGYLSSPEFTNAFSAPGPYVSGQVWRQRICTSSPAKTLKDLSGSENATITESSRPDIATCDKIQMNVRDMVVGSYVYVDLHSTPVRLGQFLVGEDGVANLTFTIPPDLSPGLHTIVVSGFDENWTAVEFEIPIRVVEPIRWYVWAASGMAGALLIGGIVLLIWGAVRRRSSRS
ncbi:MAG: VWA domain-containing protein [Propionibacteriaceae bacterium]|jgi:Mg-chelatase subunit ChlD/lysophospholipase L1-like esterase|nr:VWA domain-containing protein [Propionibacteriaceae bacterium]